jgi:signal transduction histidine kinase/HPt (histidine-containing phosphotransfer) domain-containing protein
MKVDRTKAVPGAETMGVFSRSSNHSRVNILVAEDSATQAQNLQHLLEGQGYEVRVAGNGQQALDLARQRRPTLIISDIVMPVMDGYALCKAIKCDETLKNIPVILVTTLADAQDVMLGLECGASNFLRKPYDDRHLLSRIGYLLMNLELRRNQKIGSGMEVSLRGRTHFITAERQQILDLLISSFEQAVEVNQELRKTQAEIERANQALHERELEARAANQTKSVFLATMSHEIRTPLVGVLGMLEVLGHSKLDAEQRRQFNIVQQSAGSLLEIVGDILDYSKIEAGKVELVVETLSVRDHVSRVVSMFRANAESKGLQLVQDVAATVAPAHVGDPVRIRQVLANLVSNAVKFTEPGGSVTVAVRVVDDETARQRLTFAIADTGIGMPPDQVSRLFEPFMQSERSSTRRVGGTGLGLAISSRLAELMGGTVRAESAPGRGTVMTLELRLPTGDAGAIVTAPADEVQPVRTRPKPTREQAQREGSLLLLAEDHPINRAVLTQQLSLAGFVADTVETGTLALEKFRSGIYGLVLTDLHMPGLDGLQLTTAIRRFEGEHARRHTPVIAITANALRENVEQCLAGGMDDYLSKPVTVRRLTEKLRHWLPQLDWGPAPSGTSPSDAQSRAHSPVEQAVLDQFIRGDLGKAQELLAYYCQTAADDLKTLHEAYRQKDGTAAGVAHRMKGAALMIGAHEVADIAEQIEQSVRETKAADISGMTVELQQAVARVEAYAHDLTRRSP